MVYVISGAVCDEGPQVQQKLTVEGNGVVPPIWTARENGRPQSFINTGHCSKPEVNEKTETIAVCSSCQHLYAGRATVVLDPAALANATHHSATCHAPTTTKGYRPLCECGVEGCGCSRGRGHTWGRVLPRHAPWWPRAKVALLTLAATLPWAGLVTYVVFAYRT